MAEEFHFEVIDARKSPDEIQDELRSKIQPLLTTQPAKPGTAFRPPDPADIKRPFVWLIWLVLLIWFIWLVSFNQRTRQTR